MKHLFSSFFCGLTLLATSQVGPYSWQDHLSFNLANTIAKLGNTIYASNYNGLLKIDFNELSTQRKNKINGLSDVGIKVLRTNTYNTKLLVMYENCNLDVIDDQGNIKNYPDIKLKTFSGKKIINEATFKDQFAYLSCGFGIVKFDTEKLEVKDTYIIGPNGTNLEVYQIAMDDSIIFAATPGGLYRANYKTKVLNNFNNWVKAPGLPAGPYSGVIKVNDKILAAYSPNKLNGNILNSDTMYILNNNTWSVYQAIGSPIKKLGYVNGSYFASYTLFGPQVVDVNTGTVKTYMTDFNGGPVSVSDLIFEYDHTNALSYWYSDYINGVFQSYGVYPFYSQNPIIVNGTNRSLISNIDVFDGKVAVSPSFPDNGGSTHVVREGIYILKDGNWSHLKTKDLNNNSIFDINYVYYDRKDKTRIWASSWDIGLLEFKNDILVGVYNAANTPMGEIYPGAPRCSGIAMDADGNVWFANSDSKKYLGVRKTDGTFESFTFDTPRFTRRILVDKNNFIWAIHERDQGITVFKNSNFAAAQQGVNYRVLGKDGNSGNLESNSVYSIAEDKDGKIWVGTTAGIRVFYNPGNMFSGANYDAQPIKIIQDGNVELLLEKETVTAICVDGANNKWVGTLNGGLFCFSPDGVKELYHFTIDNSPLYSNSIVDVNYDKVTGDVFIGTQLGLQSFRSAVIEGDETYQNVYAYPNPVKPGYGGNVFVRGLIDNSVVKITDESGNLVWETKSQGGQIEWPVKNLSGSRAATGVYLVYASTTTGEFKALTKVLIVN
ncbi:MAG: hypothetical protein JWO32_1346 [Bacteroidetes bacterium]|nr:hypothetical protein [Bacteroidota bacterium]